jgi:hypothetical protein
MNYAYNLVSYYYFKARQDIFEINLIVYPVIIVICLALCLLLTLSYSKTVNGTDFSGYLNGCTDSSTQSIISIFQSNFSVGQLLILISLLLSYLYLILNVYLYCMKKNRVLAEIDLSKEMTEKQIL